MTGARTVQLVFDSSAITSWLRGSLAVGETLAEIDDEHGAVLIPLWCLVEAGHATGMLDRDRLDLLLAHPATALIVDDGGDWDALVALQQLTGRPDCASAAMMAIHMDVDVMTCHPDRYADVDGGRRTLEVIDE
ncbi:hypothetical protein [Actinoplanes rectilineatus]|uniref:hypothetical protein n=1 Tax=Actinoplanes rectilineatus TaxID=113571 RepID=UPI0005F28579|nr:hypothetical protein [Actinoplanes rectilineatus]